MHLTRKEKQQHILLMQRKFNGKRDSGLTRLSGKVHLIIYCTEDRVGQNCQGEYPLES